MSSGTGHSSHEEADRVAASAPEPARGFEELVDGLPESFVFYDQSGRIAFANDEFRRRTGRSLGELLGRRPFEWDDGSYATSDDVRRFREQLDATLATGEPHDLTRTHTLPSGHTQVYRVAFRAQHDNSGRVVGAFMSAQDISDLAVERQRADSRELQFRALTENLPDVVIRYDLDGRATYVNHASGLDRDGPATSIVGLRPSEIDRPGMTDKLEFERELMRVIATGESAQVELRNETVHGVRIHSLLMCAERDARGEVCGALVIGRDITDLERARQEIAERERDFRTLAENLPDIVIRYDHDGRAKYVNHRVPNAEGRDEQHIVGKRPTESAPLGLIGADVFERQLSHTLSTGESTECELLVPAEHGQMQVHSVLIRAELDDGNVIGAIAIGRDVTELVLASRRASDSERRFRSLAENATDFIGRWAPDGRRLYVNPALARLMGTSPDQLIGLPSDEGPAGMFADVIDAIRRCAVDGAPMNVMHRHSALDTGSERIHEIRLVPEFDDDGAIVSVMGVGRDVTEVSRQREMFERAARTDALTGVASRYVLYERLPQLLQRATDEGLRVALLLVDLDGFKHINDQFGHRFGDRILQLIGSAISACVDPGQDVIRLGGDEFVLLAAVESPSDASILAHQVQTRLSQLVDDDEPLPPLDASCGIAMFPADGADPDTLLAAADLALYAAKRSGRGAVEFYRCELREAMTRRSEIDQALRRCDPRIEMSLHLQPICSLGPEPTVWGAEALLRWTHPTLGPMSPDEFIGIAEQSGHIVPIGRWVLTRAAEIAVELNTGRTTPLRINVNVSTRQFTLDDIGDAVRDALSSSGCDPAWIMLELTESLLLEDVPLVKRAIDTLRSIGVTLAIDDFGTGYSALHYLTRLRVDLIKIDKTFVRDTETDQQQQEIVRALAALARALRIDIIAEGIETPRQAEFLRAEGCALGQGYLLAKPMPVDRFRGWLAASDSNLRRALSV